jgi:hypothetical protein
MALLLRFLAEIWFRPLRHERVYTRVLPLSEPLLTGILHFRADKERLCEFFISIPEGFLHFQLNRNSFTPERGGKNAKKRAVIAVARKLAVLLHKLWVSV